MKISITQNRLYTMISIVSIIVLWKFLSIWVDNPIMIPSPESTVMEFIKIIKSKNFTITVLATLTRVIIGFSISFISALILGFSSGFFKPVYYLLRPVIIIQKATPTMAIILLSIIWLKAQWAPILVGFLIIFPIIYSNVIQGIESVDIKLIEMARVYKLSQLTVMKDIYIPSIKSSLTSVASATIGLNLKVIIAAEVLSQPNVSIGTNFQMEKANLNTAGVFAWALVSIIIAGGFDLVIRVFKSYNIKHKIDCCKNSH
ncbi:ABC transporter permease [Tepidibacter aestuarii]|uniref:ABC transporter permease n=1 Tax=Tepidibacter aestuarii TaxID=2925782 RepID=UPI0020C1270C|nr:ABC transporter permease subunit [Tepidibacter aestuarii]CAH2213052.1 ABC-type nitrate/sulfonate/bicarbonate transport system, permease component [Tepidibacter aestuarii]